MFAVVPKKGDYRLPVHDVSADGLAINLDNEEDAASLPIGAGETLHLQLYVNQTLHMPLVVKVVRVDNHETIRRIGAEIVEKGTPGHVALQAFCTFLDRLGEM
jgi:hypothetical protein